MWPFVHCGTSDNGSPEGELVGTWIHIKSSDESAGSGSLIEFWFEAGDENNTYQFRGDFGAGTYTADGRTLTMILFVGPNGEKIIDGEDIPRTTAYWRAGEDTLILEDEGEFAREGSAAVEDFLKAKAE